MNNALKDSQYFSVMDNQATGTTTVSSTTVDLAGFDSVEFVTKLGAIDATSVVTVKVQQGALSDGSDASDLKDTAIKPADTDDDKLVVHDIHRPEKQFLRVQILRATANAEVDSVTARLYNARTKPTTQATADVAGSEFHLSPIEGTA